MDTNQYSQEPKSCTEIAYSEWIEGKSYDETAECQTRNICVNFKYMSKHEKGHANCPHDSHQSCYLETKTNDLDNRKLQQYAITHFKNASE